LKKGRGLSGIVKLANGEPVASAFVGLVDKTEAAYMDRPGGSSAVPPWIQLRRMLPDDLNFSRDSTPQHSGRA
jgi:hypothetical protein